jgi:hypothetical protein
MTKTVISCCVFVLAFTAFSIATFGQKETDSGITIDRDIALMRRDLRSEKKQIIAANVPLTDAEATKFWPVYDQYTADIAKHNDEFWALVKDYVANYKTMTDDQCNAMLKRWADIQVQREQTRQKYIPIVGKVIPGRKAALFFQIDRRLWELLDLQVSSQLPLVAQ